MGSAEAVRLQFDATAADAQARVVSAAARLGFILVEESRAGCASVFPLLRSFIALVGLLLPFLLCETDV